MNTSPNSSWFYAEGHERRGPVPFHQLQEILASGLSTDSLVWTEGMENWLPAQTIPGLTNSAVPMAAASAIDTSNPYAPPSYTAPVQHYAEGVIALGEPPAIPIPLDVGFCIGQAWKYTRANLGPLLLMGIVIWLIGAVIGGGLTFIAAAIDGPPTIAPIKEGSPYQIETPSGPMSIVAGLINQVISIFLGLGALRYAHILLSGEKPELSVIFSQGSKLFTTILATILYGLMVVLGLLAFIVPGIYLALRFGLYQQAIVEKNLGVIDSLKYSSQITRDNKLGLLGLYILAFFVVVAGFLALLVGLIWAIPTAWLSTTIAYRYLHSGPQGIRVLP